MHGQLEEDKQQRRCLRPGPLEERLLGTDSDTACEKYFSKAGRTIAIGDCALFQVGNVPPFIGIIRNLSAGDGGNLKLGVNWLHRAGDIKLSQSACVEAAPNEIFYSFHKDEISAASLLHPCKVAFLEKGAELPFGVSCFVCRRVYDPVNKCLYWLTDQDYADEHQAELDQLLNRTKLQMQAVSPIEGVSQRATGSPPSVKYENADAAPSIKTKSKKRPRIDQNLDLSRQEKLAKVDNDVKQKWMKAFEDFTLVGERHRGLTSQSMVEQLLLLMSQECYDDERKPVDVISQRMLLASIIAATKKEDDLRHFVLLGGLPILDKWLQEAHKGKTGDGSPKEGDKPIEELLVTLLRALERLPVDLDALKTCMVGKSVNHLRSHRNPEIQKKARKLVDTWKKRVDAEMKCSDEVKGGSMSTATTWPSKHAGEVHSTKGHPVGGSKGASLVKLGLNGVSPIIDSKSNMLSLSVYKEHSETGARENTSKSHVNGGIDGVADVKDDKSCSSSQSQSNCLPWCSGVVTGVDEARAPASVVNKGMGPTLRSSQSHLTKPLSTGGLGSFQREPGRNKTCTLDKVGNEGVRIESGNSQRLIVRLPNPARSPSQSVNGGSLVDGTAANNKASPPGSVGRQVLEKESKSAQVHSPEMRGDTKSSKCNSTPRAHGKEEVDRSSVVMMEQTESNPLSSENRIKDHRGDEVPLDVRGLVVRKSTAATTSVTIPSSSSSSLERLIVDNAEGGIDLLASVAAREVLETQRSCTGSSTGEGHMVTAEIVEGRSKTDAELKVQIVSKDAEKPKQDCMLLECVGTFDKSSPPVLDLRPSGEYPQIATGKSSGGRLMDGALDSVSTDSAYRKHSSTGDPLMGGRGDNDITLRESDGVCHGSSLTAELQTTSPPSLQDTSPTVEGNEDVGPGVSAPKAGDSTRDEEDALEVARQVAMEVEQEVEMYSKPECGHDGNSISPQHDNRFNMEAPSAHLKPKELMLNDAAVGATESNGERPMTDAAVSKEGLTEDLEATDKDKHLLEQRPLVRDFHESPLDMQPTTDAMAEKELDKGEAVTEPVALMSEASRPDVMSALAKESSCVTKVAGDWPVFDLNEGLATEEPISTHSISSTVVEAPTTHVPFRLAGSLAAPIAVVAAAAKGPFIPPDVLRVRGELGWKGSAATSAFRPAEPRRAMESLQMSAEAIAATSAAVDATLQNGKQNRLLDIDLNVADENMGEQSSFASSPLASTNEASNVNNGPGPLRPELDLNMADGTDENAGSLAMPSRGQVGSSGSSGELHRVILDFDLNDGLGFGEAAAEHCSKLEGSGKSAAVAGMGQNLELVNGVPWYSAGGSIHAAGGSVLAGRSESSSPVVAAPGSKPAITMDRNFSPFSTDLYPGVSMSTSIPYTTSMHASFSYAGLPFGGGLPTSFNMGSSSHMSSTNLPPFLTATPQQLITAGAVMSSYGRPYLMGGMDSGTSWVQPTNNLDLNYGPDLAIDLDSGIRSAGGLGQIPHQQQGTSSASLKRKEPEGNFDPFRSGFKQMMWR